MNKAISIGCIVLSGLIAANHFMPESTPTNASFNMDDIEQGFKDFDRDFGKDLDQYRDTGRRQSYRRERQQLDPNRGYTCNGGECEENNDRWDTYNRSNQKRLYDDRRFQPNRPRQIDPFKGMSHQQMADKIASDLGVPRQTVIYDCKRDDRLGGKVAGGYYDRSKQTIAICPENDSTEDAFIIAHEISHAYLDHAGEDYQDESLTDRKALNYLRSIGAYAQIRAKSKWGSDFERYAKGDRYAQQILDQDGYNQDRPQQDNRVAIQPNSGNYQQYQSRQYRRPVYNPYQRYGGYRNRYTYNPGRYNGF